MRKIGTESGWNGGRQVWDYVLVDHIQSIQHIVSWAYPAWTQPDDADAGSLCGVHLILKKFSEIVACGVCEDDDLLAFADLLGDVGDSGCVVEVAADGIHLLVYFPVEKLGKICVFLHCA